MARLRAQIRSNAAAYAALLVTLSGVAYAAEIAPRDSVRSSSIKNGQVKSADLRNDGVRGVDVNEGSLDKVPRARLADRAADSDGLGGVAASGIQRHVIPSCTNGEAITSIGASGGISCATRVLPVSATPAAGASELITLGQSSLFLVAHCHDGAGTTVALFNNAPSTATLNWVFSKGGATSSVEADGTPLVGTGANKVIGYAGARLEGQFVFDDPSEVTTLNLHAFDGASFCEIRGSAQTAAIGSGS